MQVFIFAFTFSLRMKEDRLKKKSEGLSEVSAWVSRSRKLEDKRNVEKEKALQLSKIFEEQVNILCSFFSTILGFFSWFHLLQVI